MALIPALWLLVTKNHRPEWWWIAAAFFVSWLADTAAHRINPELISTVYPVGQASLMGAVLLNRQAARFLLLGLVVAALLAIEIQTLAPDRFLRTVAWLGIVAIVWDRPLGRLRVMLLTAFGLGWVAWIGYTFWPGWTSWSLYQGIRAVSIAQFCWASQGREIILA